MALIDTSQERFRPDAAMSADGMKTLQRELADEAVFANEFDFMPTLDDTVVAGVDQAFVGDEKVVSGVVLLKNGEIIERKFAVRDVELPYIPGLLSFREGNAILDAYEKLEQEPDLLMIDGSGRIHFREAGIATHIGVMADKPAVGVAKNLLCGQPAASLDDPLSQHTRVPIVANGRVETVANGTVIGYAFQSRQYESGNQAINPLYVSAGHRVTAETAVDFVEQLCDGYKLPRPTRLADHYVAEQKKQA